MKHFSYYSVIARVLARGNLQANRGDCFVGQEPKLAMTREYILAKQGIPVNIRYCLLLFCIIQILACNTIIQKDKQKKYTISVTDLRGKKVQLEKPAERIVCLFNGSFDGIYMLHAEQKLVGIPSNVYTDPEYYDSYAKLDDRIKNKTIPTPGSWQAANIESIVSLQPDLVLISYGQKDAIEILERMGMNVYVVSSETYDRIYKEILDIGKLTATEERAKELVAYSMNQFEKIRNRTQNITPKKRVYYAWSGGRILSTSGRNSMINDCIKLAGAENVCTADVDQPNVNPELLIHWNPDLIFLWDSKPADVYSMSALADIKAVKTKNVQTMAPAFFYNTHTLKILLAAVMLNHWCYDTFDAADIERDKADIIKNLYGPQGMKLL